VKKLIKKAGKALRKLRNLGHARRFEAARKDHPPIFIVGCGHSGTSLLLAVLGMHSNIYAVPNESGLAFCPSSGEPAVTEQAKKMMRRFDEKTIEAKKLRWVEKTPSHIKCIPQLLELCPDARILLIIRDGRDVACSMQDRTGDLNEGILRWVTENRIGETFWNHPQVHHFKYEDLVANFQDTVTKVVRFVGEEFEQQLLNYHEKPRHFYANTVEKPASAFGENHEKYRNWQINQPLFDGRDKWKRLTEAEKQQIKAIAGDMLIEYGYAKDQAW
jgi:hypothetical protein